MVVRTAELRDRESRLRALLGTMPDQILVMSGGGRILENHGQSGNQPVGRGGKLLGSMVGDVLPHGVVEAIEGALRSALDSGTLATTAYEFATSKGRRSFEVRIVPQESDRVVALVRDITERVAAESRLRDSESQTRLLIDNLPALITYMGSDQHFRYVSHTAEEWYGRPSADIVDPTVAEILGPAYEKLGPRMEPALSGKEVTFEDKVSYPDGNSRNVQVTYAPNLAEDGEGKGYFGLVLDLTDRIRAEQKLQTTQRLLKNVFETIPNSLDVKDLDLKHVLVKKEFLS